MSSLAQIFVIGIPPLDQLDHVYSCPSAHISIYRISHLERKYDGALEDRRLLLVGSGGFDPASLSQCDVYRLHKVVFKV